MARMWYAPWREVEEKTVSQAETKSFALGTSEELGAFMVYGNAGHAATPASALSLYEKSSAVAVPINMIADSFSVLDPILVIDEKVVKEHEALDLLKQPSPYFDQQLFLETVAKDYLITGEYDTVAIGNVNRPPIELEPISPRNRTFVEGANGIVSNFIVSGNHLPGNYKWTRKGADVRYYDGNLKEFRQVRSYSTRGNSLLAGQSKLLSAAKEARQHILGTDHNVSLLEKGGRVSLVFHFDADMDEDDYEETKKRIIEQYGGAAQAGQIGVTVGGKLDIKDLQKAGKDMDYPKLQAVAVMSCALIYRVPLPLIIAERQTMNNYREAKLALFDDAVIPLARRIFGGLSYLLPRFGLDPRRARYAFDPEQVTALMMRRNEEIKKRAEIAAETINEIRSLLGREAIEGGNQLLVPATMVPIGTDTVTEDEDVAIVEIEDDTN